jgi:hypothetical protein
MKESDIQDYLYHNPEILFPSGTISEKAREYNIHGKRIDLLFVVDGIRYIVEIKKVPIQKEHIGQVVEYYGLMKHYMKETNLAMILVSPSIPEWRAAYLEELGIRCVEIPEVPTVDIERNRIQKESRIYSRKVKQKADIESALVAGEKFSFEDITRTVNSKGLAFANLMLRDSLEPIRTYFSEYEVFPFGIKWATSNDFDLEHYPGQEYGTNEFTRGGTWWAYRFGFSEDLSKNDVPNVSIIANTTGLDVTLNAELQSSQKVLLRRIHADVSKFDKLLANHGRLWLKTYLKFEHQPRFYHWILADMRPPGEFDGKAILDIRREHEEAFIRERERWINIIKTRNKELTEGQNRQLEARNKRLNLAIRLVEPFEKSGVFWSLPYEGQLIEIVKRVQQMKPLVDFFVMKNCDLPPQKTDPHVKLE